MRMRLIYGLLSFLFALSLGISTTAEAADSPTAYLKKGMTALVRGNPDDALTAFERAILLAPNSADAYYGRGCARQSKGDVDAAIEDFNHALALDPKHPEAYVNRANALQEKSDLIGA